jgi:excisionase family DNA binding protein
MRKGGNTVETYSVKEIADILNTNPETVRRWIRSGKLKAVQESRKGGSVITEQMLQSFLKASPKYAGVAATMLANPIGITVATATVLGGILTHQHLKSEQLKNSHVNSSDLIKLLKVDIVSRKGSVKRKQDAIKQLQQEINEENQRIEEAKRLIMQLSKSEEELE